MVLRLNERWPPVVGEFHYILREQVPGACGIAFLVQDHKDPWKRL